MLTATSEPAAMSRPPTRVSRRVVNQNAFSAHRYQTGRMLGRPPADTVARWARRTSPRKSSSSSGSSGMAGLLHGVLVDEQQPERAGEVGQVVGGGLGHVTLHVVPERVPVVPPQLGH